MPIYLIERNFAEKLEVTPEGAEAIIEAARRAGIPADIIIEVGQEIVPSGDTLPFNRQRYAQE